MKKRSVFEAPGAEQLGERDRKLNELARMIEVAAHALGPESYKVIKVADSQDSESHAELRTDEVAKLKEKVALLNRLLSEAESAAGIIKQIDSPELKEAAEQS
jgi:hypothetical protein